MLDVYSRRIVGWAMATHLKTELVLDGLDMALTQRRPARVIHHSDRGSQYTSVAFGQRCREMGVQPSMGSRGDGYDNALAESFFATLECELLARHRFKTQSEARIAVFSYIEGWYNPHRRHSALGQRSPITFDRETAHTAWPPSRQPFTKPGELQLHTPTLAANAIAKARTRQKPSDPGILFLTVQAGMEGASA